jgi:hypothetical protein
MAWCLVKHRDDSPFTFAFTFIFCAVLELFDILKTSLVQIQKSLTHE